MRIGSKLSIFPVFLRMKFLRKSFKQSSNFALFIRQLQSENSYVEFDCVLTGKSKIIGVVRNCKNKGGGLISTFFRRIFFGRTNLKLIEKQEVRGHAHPKKFYMLLWLF